MSQEFSQTELKKKASKSAKKKVLRSSDTNVKKYKKLKRHKEKDPRETKSPNQKTIAFKNNKVVA